MSALRHGGLVAVPPHAVRKLAGTAPLVCALAVAVSYPLLVGRATSMGGGVGDWLPALDSAVIILVFTMMAVGLNVVVGYAGLLDLGYVAFYAAGAYAAAWLASLHFSDVSVHVAAVGVGPDAPGIHVNLWLVLVLAGVFSALIGTLIGLPTLRLRGDYLAIVTLGFGEIVPQFVRNGDKLGGFNLTNGTFGISPIDSPGFGTALSGALGLPVSFQTSLMRDRLFYYGILALLLATVVCCVRLRGSRIGRAWIAIREDETAASAMGIPLMRTKTWAYAIGAFFGGVAGAYYASFKSGAFPSDFFFNVSIFLLCMVILGGIGSMWGVLLAGIVLAWLNVEGLAVIGSKIDRVTGLGLDVPKYQYGIYGIAIVLMMLFRPQGLVPERRHALELAETTHDSSVDRPPPAKVSLSDVHHRPEAGSERTILALEDVHTHYGAVHALKGVTVDVREGEVVTLIGSNGAGKSTTLRTVSGIVHARRGRIRFEGRDITPSSPHEIVQLGIAHAPEGRRVFARMSVHENLVLGAFARDDRGDLHDDLDRVYSLFPRLHERRSQDADTLSGGEQQMCAIGRALMARPKLLLLDEPSMGLAPNVVETIRDTIVELKQQGTPILLVEQNALMALDVADRGYVLETGTVALAGPADALRRDERVRKTYLGEGE